MLRITPIYGSTTTTTTTTTSGSCSGEEENNKPKDANDNACVACPPPSCTLVEYGGVRLLIDVGWDESCTKMSKKDLPLDVDAILVTDSTLSSIGGLPRYFGRKRKKQRHRKVDGDQSGGDEMEEETKKKEMENNNNEEEEGDEEEDASSSMSSPPPIYGTFPTMKMGQMTLYDAHANNSLDGKNPGYDLEDVDEVLSTSRFHTLKYSQTLYLPNDSSSDETADTEDPKIKGRQPYQQQPLLGITPHRAGRVTGASFWILRRLADETEVVIAPSYHHARERHLDSTTLHRYAAAADVLVTRPGGPTGLLGSLYRPPSGGKAALGSPSVGRDEGELIELVMAALRRGGNALLPVDASGRVLELLLLLSQQWDRHRLGSAYNLCWVGSMSWNTTEFSRSQLEWMAEPLGRQFDSQRGHPFALKSVHICSSLTELDQVIESSGGNPSAVLASGPTLDSGPARDLLLRWADNPDHVIVLTDSSRCVLRGDILADRMGQNDDDDDGDVVVVDADEDEEDDKDISIPTAKTTGKGTRKRESRIGRSSRSSLSEDKDTMMTTNSGTTATKAGKTLTRSLSTGKTSTTTSTATTATTAAGASSSADDGAEDDTNIVGSAIAQSDVSVGSTSAQLLRKWCEAKAAGEEMPDVVDIDVLVPHRAPLAGTELKSFLAEEEATRRRKKAEEERRAMLREVELAKGRLRLGEDDASSTVGGGSSNRLDGKGAVRVGSSSMSSTTGTSSKKGGKLSAGGGAGQPPKKKSRFDPDMFLKFSKPLHMTFEVREEAVGIGQSDSIAKYGIGESIGQSGEVLEDDYGIAVIPDRFVDIVTGIDPSKYSGGTGRIGENVLGRGLGFGADGRPVLGSSGLPIMMKGEGGDGSKAEGRETSEKDELALEAADLSEGTGIIRGRNGRPPIKVSTLPRRIEILAEVAYVPLEGRVDARAARQSVRALQPRQVVILGGGTNVVGRMSEEASLLADAVRSLTIGGDSSSNGGGSIFAPSDGETTELSVGHAAYSVRLIDTPYVSKEERESGVVATVSSSSSLEDLSNAPVEPFEAKMGECTVSVLDCVATGKRVAADGSIVLAPHRTSEHSRHHHHHQPTVMISDGDVLLTDLRSEIIAQGMKAEYSAHSGYSQLIINGKILVRKDQASGNINVEGPLCEDYFAVRSVVCAQYVTL